MEGLLNKPDYDYPSENIKTIKKTQVNAGLIVMSLFAKPEAMVSTQLPPP